MEGIKETILKFLRIDGLIDNLSGYVDARVKLIKIELREEVAEVLSKGMVHFAIAIFLFLFLIFLSIGMANYLNTLLDNSYYGYWIIAGFYLLLFIIFLALRKSINSGFESYFSKLIKRKEG